MIIKSVYLRNFRNYKDQKIEFDEKLNIIHGSNAQGKTNILEAIYMFSLGKSNRAKTDREIITFGEDEGEVCLEFSSRGREQTGRIILNKNGRKKVYINDIFIRKNSELVGNLNVVFFGPEYLSLIREGPKKRRKNLDTLICQLKPAYLNAVSEYKRIIEQKSSLLKDEKPNRVLLSVLNEKILELNNFIVKVRHEYIRKIEKIANEIQLEISNGEENLSMNYISSGTLINAENVDNLSTLSAQNMVKYEERELKYRECMFGPHRDDIEFLINGRDLKLFGSQGQQKTAILVQKIAEVELFMAETGEYPVLLLDDIMSELDTSRQEFVINKIKNMQIFITSTDSEKFKEAEMGKFLKIEKGELAECFSI